MKLYIPVPDGWTRTDHPDRIVVEGDVPDGTLQWNTNRKFRGRRIRAEFALKDGKLQWRGAKISVKQEIEDYAKPGTWRKAGKGGAMLAGTLLWTLTMGGANV